EERGEEDTQQQLESDEEAIRIMTMHGAKGLQFPVVFCPFLWYRTGGFAGEEILVRSHENGQWLLDLGSEKFDQRREKALFESLAEELRLFYVAVTRAELRCYVMLAYCQGQRGALPSAKSALGYLFFHGQEISQQEQEQIFREFAESSGAAYQLLDPEPASLSRYQGTEDVQGLLMPRKSLGRTLQTDYQMSSYSAMAALGDHGSHAVLPEDEADTASSQAILHRGLPYGPVFGNLIHDCLETISFTAFQENENQETVAAITRICGRYAIDVDVALLQRFLGDIVTTEIPLPDSRSFSLAAVDPAQCAKEMGFYFHHNRFRTGEINEILASDPAVTALSAATMRGYLTGFIDLFFQYDGKYYVMDYKTNFLGD
ncbi:MAG: exodeoxyribonuclease V subunit beta, partial [Deltaproteobacteria bacterium]